MGSEKNELSRRAFLATATAAVPVSMVVSQGLQAASAPAKDRLVDVHHHFDEKNPKYIDDFLRISDRLNLTACMLTPFAHRKVVAEAARIPHPDHPVRLCRARCSGCRAAGEGAARHGVSRPW